MKKTPVYLSLALSLSLAVTGCGGGQKSAEPGKQGDTGSAKQVLHMNNTEEPGSLHPGKAQGTHDSWPLEHMMEGLMKKDPSGKIVPGIAKDAPQVSPDGKTYTFTIRDDAKWSNGDPVTAQDFEYAWKYALNPATASEYAYQLYYLKGGEAYNTSKEKDAAKLKALEDAVGVKAKDDKTLVITLAAPTPYFTDLTSFYTYYPVDKKVQEKNPNWANEASTYVSDGPFKLVEWKHKQDIKMAKNENYYDKDKIKLDEIDWAEVADENTAWQMYKSGQLDIVYPLPTDVLGQLKSSNNPELHIAPDLSTYYYAFNTKKKPFDNVNIRKALSMAIDRNAIVTSVAQGGQKPAYGLVPPGIPDADGKDFQANGGDYFKEDVAQAKELLAKGLKEEGLTAMPKFTIVYNTNNGHKAIAEAIQEMWRKNLGVNVTLQNVEFQVKIDKGHKGDFEVLRDGWIGDFVDPMTFIDLFTKTSTQNDSAWTSPDYDKLAAIAKTSTDQAARMKAMHDAEKLMMDQMPIMPVYFYTKPYTLKPNVKGVFEVVNRYPQMMYAEISK